MPKQKMREKAGETDHITVTFEGPRGEGQNRPTIQKNLTFESIPAEPAKCASRIQPTLLWPFQSHSYNRF